MRYTETADRIKKLMKADYKTEAELNTAVATIISDVQWLTYCESGEYPGDSKLPAFIAGFVLCMIISAVTFIAYSIRGAGL